jgi:3-deoxy-D-manno-octulosonate 8-phosphate phosphatase (KDO 8-P phosphatase)
MSNYKEKLKNITTFVFDYDGVFSDGVVYIMENGEMIRTTHSRDGYALQLALKHGYRIAVITGADSKGVVERFKHLDIPDVYIGASDKLAVYDAFCAKYGLHDEEILVMGDDIPDYPILERAGVACCPADAVWEIRNLSEYVSIYPGGKGCVRDIIEQVLRLQGKWLQTGAYHW